VTRGSKTLQAPPPTNLQSHNIALSVFVHTRFILDQFRSLREIERRECFAEARRTRVDVGDYVGSGVSTDRVLKVEKFPYNVGTSNQRRGAIFSNIAGGIRRRIDSAKKVLFVHTKNASDGNVTQQMQRQTQ